VRGDSLGTGVRLAVAIALGLRDPAKVAPGSRVPFHLAGELVPRHGRQELEQLIGRLQLELAEGGADEEARQDRLADVH
jgi:hypothetical protein